MTHNKKFSVSDLRKNAQYVDFCKAGYLELFSKYAYRTMYAQWDLCSILFREQWRYIRGEFYFLNKRGDWIIDDTRWGISDDIRFIAKCFDHLVQHVERINKSDKKHRIREIRASQKRISTPDGITYLISLLAESIKWTPPMMKILLGCLDVDYMIKQNDCGTKKVQAILINSLREYEKI
jgi:hypothetical protein